MSEVEKQEGQKTVVSFITGLLIGGLLVWVFSSTPEKAAPEMNDEETTEESSETEEGSTSNEGSTSESTEASAPQVSANGSLTVDAQKAGNSVALGKVSYPSKEGWIVVRDYADGVAGRILGAARYHLDDGLVPTEVTLLRNTVSGSTYQVQFYSENGDRKFDTKTDVAQNGGEVTFTAN